MTREKVIHCGKYGVKSKYIEVDLYHVSGKPIKKRGRSKKHNISSPTQAELNAKNAARYLNQLCKTNFTSKDYHISLTYDELPSTVEEAEANFKNYIRRVNHRRKMKGLKNAKYICVTETSKNGRVHHHVIMENGLPREETEMLWSRARINWLKYDRMSQTEKEEYAEKVKLIGFANTQRLQFNNKGIEELTAYLSKDPQGRRRWKQSRNLIKPWYMTPKDGRYSKRKIEKMALLPQDCEKVRQFWERKYKGYILDEARPEFNPVTGQWSIYLKMHLKD